MMYAQDFDEMMPAFYHYYYQGDSSVRYFGPYDGLAAYTMNEQIYVCPSGHFTDTGWRGGLPRDEGFFGRLMRTSYGVVPRHSGNSHLGTAMWESGWGSGGHSMADVQRPSEKILILEMNARHATHPDRLGFTEDGSAPLPMADDGSVGRMMYRHNRMMNAAYADGHVKTIPQLTSPDPLMRN